jgi:hypothetical protein
MFPSDRFLSRIAGLKKTKRNDSLEQQIDAIRVAFVDACRNLPAPLVLALFEEFESSLKPEGDESAFDHGTVLGDIVDVLHGQYDSENDPLDQEDWSLIGAVLSDFAFDLDMELVTYVMKLAVDHGGV